MARPLKEIDWNEVERRMEAGNNAIQIAKALRIDLDTFYLRFKKEFGCGFQDFSVGMKECGDANIAFAQYKKAMGGNVRMLIRLGAVRLGQREPDSMPYYPPNQIELNKDHENMLLKHRIAELEANANKPETR